MEHKRILELALEALEKQRTHVEAEIEAIRAEMHGGGRATSTRKAGSTASLPGKRRVRTTAERKAQSKRMKTYWAAKRASEAASAKKVTNASPKRRSKRAAEKKA